MKSLSRDEMKKVMGGMLPGGGGSGDGTSCRVNCSNGTTYDCWGGSSSCDSCSTTTTSCSGYNSDCKPYTYNC